MSPSRAARSGASPPRDSPSSPRFPTSAASAAPTAEAASWPGGSSATRVPRTSSSRDSLTGELRVDDLLIVAGAPAGAVGRPGGLLTGALCGRGGAEAVDDLLEVADQRPDSVETRGVLDRLPRLRHELLRAGP